MSELSESLRGLAADPHARAVLAKAFREAPLANAAEALHALADGLDAGLVLRPRATADAEARALRDAADAAVPRFNVHPLNRSNAVAVWLRERAAALDPAPTTDAEAGGDGE